MSLGCSPSSGLSKLHFKKIRAEIEPNLKRELAAHGKHASAEQSLPSYLHKFWLVRLVFWRRLERVLKICLESESVQHVFDFGSGSGVILPFYSKFVPGKIYSFDSDPLALQMTKNLIAEHSLQSVEVLSDLESIQKIPDSSIDIISALDVLEHIENLEDVLAEFRRILTENGKLIVCSPTESFLYRFSRKFGGSEYKLHFHHFNARSVESKLAQLFQVKLRARLFPIFVYFRIVACSKANNKAGL